MVEIRRTIKKKLEELKERYENGEKKALSQILALLKKDIFELINQGVSIKTTKEIISEAINLKISDNTFYKWVNRQRKKGFSSPVANESIKNNANALEREKNRSKPVKTQNKGAKAPLNQTKGVKNEKLNPTDILNSDINLVNNKYKDLL